MRQPPLPPQGDKQEQWFVQGQADDSVGKTIIIRPHSWSEEQFYWYERGVIERSRLYADKLEMEKSNV